MKFIDCLPRKPELRDYNSPEKAIINTTFNSLPYMDMWISSIVEGYIYEKVDKVDEKGNREEYTTRYSKLEGEGKLWRQNGQLWYQGNYKDGKEHGKIMRWNAYGKLEEKYYCKNGKTEGKTKTYRDDGTLFSQGYYKEGKKEGNFKQFWNNTKVWINAYYKHGELEGEYKEFLHKGGLSKICYYKNIKYTIYRF